MVAQQEEEGAVSSTVSVLKTVLGPIHTTLLGLFHPRSPQTLWNSGGLTGGSCSHVWNSPPFLGLQMEEQPSHTNRSLTFFPGPVLLLRVNFASICPLFSSPSRRLIETHRRGLGNFPDSNKRQRMDR